jgi:hypothetical protein
LPNFESLLCPPGGGGDWFWMMFGLILLSFGHNTKVKILATQEGAEGAEGGVNLEVDNKPSHSHFPLSARLAAFTALLIPVTKV